MPRRASGAYCVSYSNVARSFLNQIVFWLRRIERKWLASYPRQRRQSFTLISDTSPTTPKPQGGLPATP